MEVPDLMPCELALEKEAALGTDNTDEGEIKLRAAEGADNLEEGSFVSQMAPPPVREVVVSLAMIRNLVFSYANGAVLPSDIFAIEEALCYILVHTHNWIKNQEEDEEEEEVPVDEALSPEEEERRLEIVAAAREEDVNDKIAIP